MKHIFRWWACLLLCCAPFFSVVRAQQPPAGGVSVPGYRQELALVREANPKFYKTLATCTNGKSVPADGRAIPPLGTEATQCRLVVLFKKSAVWAGALQTGRLAEANPKLNDLLAKHRLSIAKWYDADPVQDGLVLKPDHSSAELLLAAKELSRLSEVTAVFVKSPK